MTIVRQWSGHEASALQAALRMTVHDFADYLGVSPRTVANWRAKGHALRPLPEMQAALDTALSKASPEGQERFDAMLFRGEVGSSPAIDTPAPAPVSTIRPGVIGSDSDCQGHVPSSDPERTEQAKPGESEWSSEVGDPTDRREALRLLGTGIAGVAAGGWLSESATEAMEFTRRTEATEVGPGTLEHLELAIAGMASAFAHTPPADLFPQAQWYRRHVAQLLNRRKHTFREGRELYRCAGWLSIVLGWLSHDLGDSLTGEAYCLDAWEHGWQIEQGDICAWAMDAAATIAMYNNRPEAAHQAALKGLSQAPVNSAAAVRVSCQLTRACARLGRSDDFQVVLRDTQQQLDRLPGLGSGLFSADAGRIASYAATSSIWLDRPERAVAYAHEALAFYEHVGVDERSPTREAIARLDLALALVQLQTPDGAIEAASHALDTERVTGSMLARAGDVDAALRQQYATYAGAKEFHERYNALTMQARRPKLTAWSTD